MDSLRTIAPVLLLIKVILAKEMSVNSNYVIRHITSCPSEGYYFRRELVPNAVAPGPCYLCFCQEASTAICWLREDSRCDVEKFHHHRVGRHTRVARGLSDIFFRDLTRGFFNKQLPAQCKPGVESFSDGCPPVDWCMGCTVCDCDPNGQWDCHILSFCNGDEKNNNMKNRKVSFPLKSTKRESRQGQQIVKEDAPKHRSPKPVDKKPSPKPQTIVKKPNNNNKKLNDNVRKSNQNAKKVNLFNRRPQQKNRPRLLPKEISTSKMPQNRRKAVKQPQVRRIVQKKRITTRAPQKKIMRKKKQVSQFLNFTQSELSQIMKAKNPIDETHLGRQIAKRVMYKVERMIAKQIANLQNTTRVQRSINSKNAKHFNKKNRVKDAKNKNTRRNHYAVKQQRLKNNENYRTKREALNNMSESNFVEFKYTKSSDMGNLIDVNIALTRITENATEHNFNDLNKTTTTLQIDNSVNSTIPTEKSVSHNTPLNSNPTTANILYYQYSLENNGSKISSTTKAQDNVKTNENSIFLDLIETKKYNTTDNIEKEKQYTTVISHPQTNDHKHYNWERNKMFQKNRDSKINNKINDVLKFNYPEKTINDTVKDFWIKRLKYNIRRNNMIRKLVTKKQEYNNIFSNDSNTASTKSLNSKFVVTDTKENINKSSIQGLLQNFIKELNSSITATAKKTKPSVFKYMRNIFKKLFSSRKNSHLAHKTNEVHTLEVLCKNIGACFMNEHNRLALRSKIHELNTETEKIFRTIKMIKFLLYFIDIPINQVKNTTQKSHHRDIQKLDAILKGTYITRDNNSLSETQEAKIRYVKKNIHEFIESVGKFTTILNEIMDELYKNNKKYSCQRNMRYNRKEKNQNLIKKIKKILIKYNIIQNTFINKIYKLLKVAKKNMTSENPKTKVTDIEMSNTQAIDKYSTNIIENLIKLKNLAQALKSSRKKRHTTRDDDAIEYLLTLMEYILKQNHPLDTAPVNDGIDLLIEAIQNAPVIKPIKKKVLDFLPTTTTPTQTTSDDLSYSKENSPSDAIAIFKEDNNSSGNEYYVPVEHVAEAEEDEATPIVFYKKFDDTEKPTTAGCSYGTTTEYETKRQSQHSEKNETVENRYSNPFESTDERKFETFSSDLDDEADIQILSSTEKKQELIKAATKVDESTSSPVLEYKIDDNLNIDKKSKFDWIEENFGREINAYRDDEFNTNATISSTTPVTEEIVTIKPVEKNVDNISSITVELEEEKKMKNIKTSDEVLQKKQMEFLNSLDYGETERTEFDDLISKDDERDGFPSYFVK